MEEAAAGYYESSSWRSKKVIIGLGEWKNKQCDDAMFNIQCENDNDSRFHACITSYMYFYVVYDDATIKV